MQVLIIKTGALGDVLRTTAILPGLAQRYGDPRVTWLTADGAVDLVRLHPQVAEVVACDPRDKDSVRTACDGVVGQSWGRVISLDDEQPLCALASAVVQACTARTPDAQGCGGVLSGAYLRKSETGDLERAYTDDVAPWFDMGLLSRFGKTEADRRKLANRRSHPEIYADMLGIAKGEPELPLTEEAILFARAFARRTDLHGRGPVVGMNTGSGGRWESKKLPVDRTLALMEAIAAARAGDVTFLILGGPEEAQRNRELLGKCEGRVRAIDGGTDNSLLDFAALVDRLDLLITSDSLALHMANARRVPILAFFAPTSAAEIDVYGRGVCVASTAPDYCSYAKDADTASLTVERLAPPALELLARGRPR